MDRVAVFVDAGYVFAQGSAAICGQKAPRDTIILDAPKAIKLLKGLAESKSSSCRLLRIYWYDGNRSGAGQTIDQATLAHLDDVKLRLGFVNSYGQQKGVDSLIVTDLIELARLKSISDALLLSGDEDVRVGVQIAQNYGVRVHLVGIHPARGSQSLQLQQEADTTIELSPSEIGAFLSIRANAAPGASAGAAQSGNNASLESAVDAFVSHLSASELDGIEAYWTTDRGVPADLDRKLLPMCGQAIGRRLERDEIKRARSEFQKRVRAILNAKQQ